MEHRHVQFVRVFVHSKREPQSVQLHLLIGNLYPGGEHTVTWLAGAEVLKHRIARGCRGADMIVPRGND